MRVVNKIFRSRQGGEVCAGAAYAGATLGTHKKVNKKAVTASGIAVLGVAALGFGVAGMTQVAAAVTAGQDVDFSVRLMPSLQMEIPSDTVQLQLVPRINQQVFNTSDLSISVGTNAPKGYTLQVSTTGGATELTKTVAGSDGNYAKIQTLVSKEGGYSQSDFTVNRWGYKVDDATNYLAFPDTSTNALALKTTSGPGDVEKTTMTFGAKVDMTQEAGLYELTLNFQAVANAYTSPLAGLTSMQDAAKHSGVCTVSEVGAEATLKDERDGKTYKVKKLEDGNCWMMQNLDLGSSTLSKDLDSTNTHLASGTTVTASTFNGWIKSSGTGTYTSAELIPVSGSDSYGNAYGTLYNYCAASAGTYCMSSSTASDGNATQDLCPAGWRLPTGGSSGEFQALTTAYGISSNAAGSTKLQETLAFPLAGYFSYAAPDNQGVYGSYWSSTRSNSTNMYYLYFGASSVYPAYTDGRNDGYSVRCVMQ